MKVPAGTARRTFSGEKGKKGSFSSATVHTRRPGPTSQARHQQQERARKYSQVSRGNTGEGPGAGRAGGGGARTGRPGRRRRGSPGLLGSPHRPLPALPRAEETLVRLRCAAVEGFARPGTAGGEYRVSGGAERGAARSGAARAAGGAGLAGAGALPCLGLPLYGGPR